MKRQFFLAAILICVFLLTIFFPLFFENKAFFFGDNFTLMVPGKIFAAQTIKKQGVVPLWQPYILSGTPFFADLNQSLFHPSTLLFLFFDPGTAVNLTVLVHLFIGALGVFLLLRQKTPSFILAIGCSFIWIVAEPTIGWSNSFTFLQSGAWAPWLLYLAINTSVSSRWFIPVITLSILGGHPQPLVYTLAAITLYFLYFRKWKRLLSLICACLISVSLLSPILIPFAEYSVLSTRNAASTSEKVAGSLHPLHLIHWFIPTFFSNPSTGIAWGPDWDHIRTVCGYLSLAGLIGVTTSILSLKKLRHNERFFTVLAMFSVGFALLGNFPVLASLVYHIPFINSFRNPSASVFLYVIAAIWFIPNFFTVIEKGKKKTFFYLLITLWILCLGFLLIWNRFSFPIWTYINTVSHNALANSQIHTFPRDVLIVSNILRQVCISLGLLIVTVLFFWRFKFVAIFIIVLDIYLAHSSLLLFAPKTVYSSQIDNERLSLFSSNRLYRSLSLSGYLPYTGIDDYWKNIYIKPPFGDSVFHGDEAQSFIQLRARQANLAVNWNQTYAIPTIDGYATMLLQTTSNFWKNPHTTQTRINYIDRVDIKDDRLNDQGVRYFAFDKTAFPNRKIPQDFLHIPIRVETDNFAILENTNALPIIRYSTYPLGTITPLYGTVNQMNFLAENATESAILVKVTPYPGWKCVMDGKPCTIEHDGLGMKVAAPAGKHTYSFQFIPTGFPFTLWVSGGTIIGLVLFLYLQGHKKVISQ